MHANKNDTQVYYSLPFFPPGLLPVLGPLESYMMPTLDAALLISYRAGAGLGRTSDRFEKLGQLGFLISKMFIDLFALQHLADRPGFITAFPITRFVVGNLFIKMKSYLLI